MLYFSAAIKTFMSLLRSMMIALPLTGNFYLNMKAGQYKKP
jgi:hypothetical protein